MHDGKVAAYKNAVRIVKSSGLVRVSNTDYIREEKICRMKLKY